MIIVPKQYLNEKAVYKNGDMLKYQREAAKGQ